MQHHEYHAIHDFSCKSLEVMKIMIFLTKVAFFLTMFLDIGMKTPRMHSLANEALYTSTVTIYFIVWCYL